MQAIFIECSYPSDHPAHRLFGHLNTTYLFEELALLAGLTDPEHPKSALAGLKVIVMHIKDAMLKDKDVFRKIEEELQSGNELGIEFLLARQGDRILL